DYYCLIWHNNAVFF
nr:immunoglobulin light chain junction region [Macaca mulatta]